MCEILDFIALALFDAWYSKKKKEKVDEKVHHTPVVPLVEDQKSNCDVMCEIYAWLYRRHRKGRNMIYVHKPRVFPNYY